MIRLFSIVAALALLTALAGHAVNNEVVVDGVAYE